MLAWIRVDAWRIEGGLEECYRKSHTLELWERSADLPATASAADLYNSILDAVMVRGIDLRRFCVTCIDYHRFS